MLKQAVRAGRIAFAGLLTVCTSTVPALAAPDGRTSTLTMAAGGAGVLWTAVSGLGLWRSIDGGASWAPVPLDSPQSWFGVTTDPVDPLTAYATGKFGVAKTTDGGATWQTINSTPGAVLGIAPGAPATLYLASPGDITDLATVSRSDDGGATWRPLATLPPHSEGVHEIDVDPEDPDNVFIHGFVFHLDAGAITLHSVDGGRSWALASVPGDGNLSALSWDLRAPETLLGMVRDGPVRSRDNGATWEIVGAGLPAGAIPLDLAFERSSGATYLALLTPFGEGQIWTSADDGTTWTTLFQRLGTIAPLVLDGALPGRLYAGTQNGPNGLLVSADAGLHWQAAGGSVPPRTGSCVPSDTVLCLVEGRFALQLHWTRADGTGGDAHASPLTDGAGGFWFFSPESLERMVKVVDGRAINGHFWLFGGSLSDLASTLTVTDLATGATRAYRNPRGRLASFADTGAFAAAGPASRAVAAPATLAAPASTAAVNPGIGAPCSPTADTLCLADSRFAVRVTWQLPGGTSTNATAVPLFQDTGVFWFFAAGNPELSVKILDGRGVNGHFWVFLAGLSSVDYTATVTDTASGTSKSYRHPAGAPASSADTSF